MIIDTITIISTVVALIVTLLTILFNPFRRGRRCFCVQKPSSDIPLSLVIVTRGNAVALKRSLPLWLSQKYNAELQIIVVIDEGDHQAEDIIKRLNVNNRIYSTFVPLTSRYMSRAKLAVTLGVKAACHDCVMLTDADCFPSSETTLQALAAYCDDAETMMVMGVTHYDIPCRNFYQYEHLYQALYCMYVAAHGKAYTTNSDCLIFHKDQFMKGQGFLGNLHLVMGEYENLVNRYALYKRTRIATSPEAIVIQQPPTSAAWRTRQINMLETMRHLRGGVLFRFLVAADQFCLHLSYLVFLSLTVYGVLTRHWIITCVAAIMMISGMAVRIFMTGKMAKALQVPVKLSLVPFHELRIFWHKLFVRIRLMVTDKKKFTSHKL